MANLNPFRPGAGHMPPYLAGRSHEQDRFRELLQQNSITENLVLTGLRGVGKTVLLETFRPLARIDGWLWTGADMSESATITEDKLATRLITDISVMTSPLIQTHTSKHPIGFGGIETKESATMDYPTWHDLYERTPGLVVDKLRSVLVSLWSLLQGHVNGVVFAYDEAQILSDRAKDGQYPLSMLLELFQSIQRQGIPFMLVLTGLPTLFPKLVEARTYSERMFHVLFLSQLSSEESRKAVVNPTLVDGCPLQFSENSIASIVRMSGGYPYFIQFICKEVFDVWLSKLGSDESPAVPEEAIISKLDNDFFAARWDKATDRERELLITIAGLTNSDDEFTVSDIVARAKINLDRPFSPSQTNQMLGRLMEKGLIYKNRHGKYSFAVPLMSKFILRQLAKGPDLFS
ncbi:AAA family ATPase [Sphingomonas sp.]|uniref:AAA family ATPase n=1 Tax=Sphingomonas sp. TaxID=28214 RepID=UPI0037520270